jgi:hypothetical protein
MSLNPLSLDPSWRDYYGSWNPSVEPYAAPLEKSNCHLPRLALVPDVLNQVVPASGKIEYNFHLRPGSLIWGFWQYFTNTSNAIQLTDVNLGHAFFQDPVTLSLLITQGANAGRFPSYTLLPTPHPVVGDGLFTLEVWGDPGDIASLILAVCEVSECPAK